MEFLAHKGQSLKDHLIGVSMRASKYAEKFGFEQAGELLGLLHDLGKYSDAFQNYLGSAIGTIDQDADEYINAGEMKGHIDHSSAGAQLLWNEVKNKNHQIKIAGQFLALCLASHHSGLIDCISPLGDNAFEKRMDKKDGLTFLTEIQNKIEPDIREKINKIITSEGTYQPIINLMKDIARRNSEKSARTAFLYFLMIRMLFSCLLDADRLDTLYAETNIDLKFKQDGDYIDWRTLASRFENHIRLFSDKTDKNRIDIIRLNVSEACLNKAFDPTGVFTLTVPTGGGKTLASLRFAIHHANYHKLDRIVYVVPFTTIIDQNANIVRDILEIEYEDKGRIVLEHHSNLIPDVNTLRNKILSENWDNPIIFTTTVQFLDTLFSAGTRGGRRMHQLANSVIIFDEIQALPLKTVHMFCNGVNYLTNFCHSSVLLCTATQPLLNVISEEKGNININTTNEIIPDVHNLFSKLKRTQVFNFTRPDGWNSADIALLAEQQVNEANNCLVITNTKKNAHEVYESVKKQTNLPVFHLSTNMCSAHRMEILHFVRERLEQNKQFICVSTQLIEAGVDVDFGSVIRFVAGLDSIAQAAGRCNRNGKRSIGKVIVINPANEVIDSLIDIKVGKEKTERILRETLNKTNDFADDMLDPKILDRYFQYYFHDRAEEMSYSITGIRDDTLLNMFGVNGYAVNEYVRIHNKMPGIYFCQSFQSASERFHPIDTQTIGIIVPFKNGEDIIASLFSQYAVEQQHSLLIEAQRYTVNVFPILVKKLIENEAVKEVPEIGVLTLCDPRYYHPDYGLTEMINREFDIKIY